MTMIKIERNRTANNTCQSCGRVGSPKSFIDIAIKPMGKNTLTTLLYAPSVKNPLFKHYQ
jgi:hypothetical protein